MSRHREIVRDFESQLATGFDAARPDHAATLKAILVKACDVSNECRPVRVSEAWVECLLSEYFQQVSNERERRNELYLD